MKQIDRARLRSARTTRLLWFGIMGGPLAWAIVHIAGYGFGIAQCDQPAARWQLPVHAFDVGVAAGGLLIGLSSIGVSLWIYLATREADDAPPQGRVHFLSVIGLVVNFLAIVIIILDGVGAPLTGLCHQS
jgi:hypothetical protein